MTLQLTLSPQLVERLRREAERQGLSPDAAAVQLLDRCLAAPDAPAQTVALLQSWIDGDDTDAGDAEYDVLATLDAARTSDRPLFPAELKGVSW